MRRHSLRSLVGVYQPVTESAHRLQILCPMCTSVRSKLPVMDLQQIGAATAGAPPSMLLQDPPAVDLVNAVHKQRERDTLFSMLRFGHQLLSRKRAIAKWAACIGDPAYLVAGQQFGSSLGHDSVLLTREAELGSFRASATGTHRFARHTPGVRGRRRALPRYSERALVLELESTSGSGR